jgi:hypothetical protein
MANTMPAPVVAAALVLVMVMVMASVLVLVLAATMRLMPVKVVLLQVVLPQVVLAALVMGWHKTVPTRNPTLQPTWLRLRGTDLMKATS